MTGALVHRLYLIKHTHFSLQNWLHAIRLWTGHLFGLSVELVGIERELSRNCCLWSLPLAILLPEIFVPDVFMYTLVLRSYSQVSFFSCSQVLMIEPDTPEDQRRKAYRKVTPSILTPRKD